MNPAFWNRPHARAREQSAPFEFRGYTLMWDGDGRLLEWREVNKSWVEAPLGLRVVLGSGAEWAAHRRWRRVWGATAIALLPLPFFNLLAGFVSHAGGSGAWGIAFMVLGFLVIWLVAYWILGNLS